MPNKFDMFFEEITKWVDDGYPVYVIYFYFQKAFGKSSTSNTNTRIKITCYGKQHNQLDSTMLMTGDKCSLWSESFQIGNRS